MIFAIIISKLVAFFLHLLGHGATTLPGRIALKLKYNILNRLSKNVHIICVTGTNGKTTTCALLSHALESLGYSYFVNKGGANMLSGVASAFILNSNIFGNCKTDYAILECDENSLPLISRYLDADVLVVTNIFRDQLDRYGEVTITLDKIKQGIDNMPSCLLLLNGDCPLTFSLSLTCNNDYLTFGINADFNDYSASDNRFCPRCSEALSYSTRIMAQLGDFYCSGCGYHRVTPSFVVNDIIDLTDDGSCFVIDDELTTISLGGIYNIYNYIAAYSALKAMGINAKNELSNFNGAFGRMEKFKFNGKSVLLLLVKNPVGLSNCVKYCANLKGSYDFAFALNDKPADGCDVSWIWDSSFLPLLMRINSAYTVGTRSLDMAVRLKHDGIIPTKIINGENYLELIKIIKNSDRDFIVLSTYTSMMKMRHDFIDSFGGREFWQ